MTFLHVRKLALMCTLAFLFPDVKSHVFSGSFTVKLIHRRGLREVGVEVDPDAALGLRAVGPAADPLRPGSRALLQMGLGGSAAPGLALGSSAPEGARKPPC